MARINPQATLGQVARKKALDHIHNTGKALGASIVSKKNSIVTVAFSQGGGYTLPQVTIPAYGPQYTRHPYQNGDGGIVLSADMIISHMDALGPSAAPGLSLPGNLSPLIFLPIGNKEWENVDPDKIHHYGKTGGVVRDQEGNSVFQTHYKKQDQQQGGSSGSGSGGGGSGSGGSGGGSGSSSGGNSSQQSSGTVGWAYGKPQDYDSANIDISKFDHFSLANDDGVTHQTKKDHNVSATGDESNSNVTATKAHNVKTPTSNFTNPNGDHQQNISGSTTATKNVTAGQTVQGDTVKGNTGQFGSMSGLGGGSMGGNSMGGNAGSSGIGSGAMSANAAANNVGALGGDLTGTLPNPNVQIAQYTFATLPTGAIGRMAVITDANSGLGWGSTVTAGGHSTTYLIWYGPSGWTVVGK